MTEEITSLKEHITEKFKNHEEIEALRHQRINELLEHYNKEIEGNEGTIRRIHSRVDRIETKIKTVQGIGTAIATALGAAAAWIGMTGGK
jgi:predicted  nucleic acid-binding Zn-ribbon protein|tara:strand:- start:55 stop:324 length:270 start_codon:yes stop_codon:yes gene_type:complete